MKSNIFCSSTIIGLFKNQHMFIYAYIKQPCTFFNQFCTAELMEKTVLELNN